MSFIKEVLGLFDLQEQPKKKYLNVSLQQGVNFNTMQSKIADTVKPQLPLIEQTTEPGLGSVQENFSVNASEQPLIATNTKEYKELKALEDDFNKTLSAYTTKQQAALKAEHGPSGGDARNLQEWQCSTGGTFNIYDTTLLTDEQKAKVKQQWPDKESSYYSCTEGCKGTCDPKDPHSPSILADTSSLTPGAAKAQLKTLFKTLQAKAQLLNEAMQRFHIKRQSLIKKKGVLATQKTDTLAQLKQLQTSEDKFNRLVTQGDTLEGELEDNRLQMNSEYLRYFIWLGAAITLGLVAMHKAAK